MFVCFVTFFYFLMIKTFFFDIFLLYVLLFDLIVEKYMYNFLYILKLLLFYNFFLFVCTTLTQKYMYRYSFTIFLLRFKTLLFKMTLQKLTFFFSFNSVPGNFSFFLFFALCLCFFLYITQYNSQIKVHIKKAKLNCKYQIYQ